MANPEHLAKLKEGVEAWNVWRENNPSVKPDLSEANVPTANLGKANLSGAHLKEANLRKANLRKANLRGVNLVEANLSSSYAPEAKLTDADLAFADMSAAVLGEADLCDATLTSANLYRADLGAALLRRAYLVGANLSQSNLANANLSEATFGDTCFAATDLRGTLGLDSCRHDGPSYLDYFTIQMNWPLPLAFLRGCGLPDPYIAYLPSLLNQSIQFYSCFISYSSQDQEFADRLHADLQNKGVRCWFAPHDIQGGRKIHEQIEEAIRVYQRLLLIISEHSMSSRWVKTEIANARKKELEQKRKVLFPIRLVSFEAIRAWKLFDADVGDDSAGELREYFIPDFTNWKDHDSYQRALDRLLRDLKAGSPETSTVAAP